MVKFILVLQLCIGGVCYPPLTPEISYDSYRSCIVSGYEQSLDFINKMPESDMQKRPVIRFWCYEDKKQSI